MDELMNQMNAQMAILPAAVQHWMNWMMLVFLLSLLFVWKKTAARYTLLSFVLTMPVGILIFYLTQTVHLLGIAHLLLWSPLAYYLYSKEIKADDFSFQSIYGVWIGLLIATIVISLVFDVRDILLVALGQK